VLSTMDRVGDKEAIGNLVSANNEHGRASFQNTRPEVKHWLLLVGDMLASCFEVNGVLS